MKKRELLIVLAFVAAGVVAYRLTATPGGRSGSAFSLRDAFNTVRQEVAGSASSASVVHTGRLEVTAGLERLRISGLGGLEITGEERADITYELRVEAAGPDETAAAEAARATTLRADDLGAVLALSVAPGSGRPVARLVLRIPARLAVSLEGAARARITNATSVVLDSSGDVRLTGIAGPVTGTQRNGPLAVTGAGALDMTLVGTDVTIRRVAGPITLSTRNGRARIEAAAGPVVIEQANQETLLVGPAREVRIGGSGGDVRIENPGAAVDIDVRRMGIDLTLGTPVPITALTTDATLRVSMADGWLPDVDAVAVDGGVVRAESVGWSSEIRDGESRLRHTGALDGARVALRNRRGDIVIQSR